MATLSKSGTPSLATLNPPMSCQVGSGLLAGEAIAAGDACYIKSDGKVWKADGSAADAAANVDGFAVRAADSGTPITIMTDVELHYGASLTPGASYYLSATAGALDDAATTGGLQPCAYAVDTTRIRVKSVRYVAPAA